MATNIFEIPTLRKFEVVDLEQLDPAKAEEEAKKLREKILPDLQKQVISALGWLETVISREAKEILEAKITKKQDEEDALAAKEGREPEALHPRKWLDSYLKHTFGPYRRTAWLALLLYHLNGPKTKEQAQNWLAVLCKKGRLVEAESGALTILGKKYSVSPEANLGQPEIRQLLQAATELESRIAWEKKLQEQDKNNTLLKEGKLSTKEFFEGKPGLLSVMPTDGTGRVEGVLVVKTTGKEVSPYNARGDAFQAEMEELTKTGKFLLLYTLSWKTISSSFFIERAQYKKREAELLMKFWQLLKSGIYRKEKKERVQAIREQLRAESSLTPEEYFEGKTGKCLLEKEGKWDWYDPIKKTQTPIYNLFFVVERMVDEAGVPHTKLVQYPAWLRDLFATCPVNIWWPEGEKFADLPQNLRMVLQSIWGQMEKHLSLEAQKDA